MKKNDTDSAGIEQCERAGARAKTGHLNPTRVDNTYQWLLFESCFEREGNKIVSIARSV